MPRPKTLVDDYLERARLGRGKREQAALMRMRRFQLYRDNCLVAEGCLFTNGAIALVYSDLAGFGHDTSIVTRVPEFPLSVMAHDTSARLKFAVSAVARIYTSDGITTVRWVDLT